METFIPTSFEDRVDAIKFTDTSGASIIVPKTNRNLVAQVFKNMATVPPLSAEIQGILAALGSPEPATTPELQEATVTVKAADILTLNETPMRIVPAPGSGKVIEVLSATFFLDYVSAAYLDPSVATIYVSYEGSNDGILGFAASDLLLATADSMQTVYPSTPMTQLSESENKAIVLTIDQAVTTGDSPIRVKVVYRIRSTT